MTEDGEISSFSYNKYSHCNSCVPSINNYYSCPRREKCSKLFKHQIGIIPYKNGQKYTIGKFCKDRENQGEFIFCYEKNTIEISCLENKFWIRLVNQDSIQSYAKHDLYNKTKEIKFQDLFHFGKYLRVSETQPGKNAFIFHERTIDDYKNWWYCHQSGFPLQPPTTFIPGQNAYILSHIMTYLSINDLKKSRMVSHLRGQEGKRILAKRACFNFCFKDGFDSQYKNHRDSMRLFLYTHDFKKNDFPPMSSWSMSIPSFEVENNHESHWDDSDSDDEDKNSEDKNSDDESISFSEYDYKLRSKEKYLEDLTLYMNCTNNAHFITRLKLNGTVHKNESRITPIVLGIYHNILHLLEDSLEELILSGEWSITKYCKDMRPALLCPSKFIKLQKLQKFTFKISVGKNVDEESFLIWTKSLVFVVQRVKTFSLKRIITSSESILLAFLEHLPHFSNLEGISLNLYGYSCWYFRFSTILEKLLNVEKPLKLLELKNLDNSEFAHGLVGVKLFEKLLEKHSSTLESLNFSVKRCGEKEELNFPILPKLKRLTLGIRKLDLTGSELSPWIQTQFKLTWGIEKSEMIDYSSHLPSLQSLSLWIKKHVEYEFFNWEDNSTTILSFWNNYGGFFRQFVTKKKCKTLKHLDIPYQVRNENCDPPLYVMRAFALTFPNVANKWLNQARIAIYD